MANETLITVEGNLTAAPELRSTQTGKSVVSFTVASTPRSFDRQTGTWKDQDALFMRCTAWAEFAENIAASFGKGDAVIVSGELVQRSWEKDGQNHTSIELKARNVAASVRRATVTIVKSSQNGTASGRGWNSSTTVPNTVSNGATAPQDDGWGVSSHAVLSDTPF